ncbi:mechanosensitive ion channel family protein [Rothia sp. ZJ932]|nr:mechanosensitive ion channel family protein [Rothia sp. ZJ1223]QRZ62544.1 mechanosensitive ion channel family protein [Rothia sp. ZJ932]
MDSIIDDLSSLDFWLGKPLRILLIIVVALFVSALVRLVIKHITASIARGTHARIISGGTGVGRWMQDTGISNTRQAQRAKTVGSVLRSVASIAIWAMAIVMIIAELGFNIAPVLASAGVVGVALSFGAQSLVKDYLTGIFIVAEDQLGIGDWVDLGEASGEVEAVGLRTTQVRDINGTLWHVRNGEILRVGNSSQGWARTNIDMPVPYDADIGKVNEVLLSAAQRAVESSDISEHVVGKPEIRGVEKVSGESMIVRVTVKTAPSEQWTVARVLRLELKQALDAAGYCIPLLNQSVVRSADGTPPTAVAPTSTGTGTTA